MALRQKSGQLLWMLRSIAAREVFGTGSFKKLLDQTDSFSSWKPSLLFHWRPASTQASQPGSTAVPELPSKDVEYHGSFGTPHKRLKQVSLGNTIISLAASPIVLFYADMSPIARVGLATTLVAFGVFTTVLLHWCTYPYVHELHYDAKTQQIRVRTVNLLGRPKWHQFPLTDVTYPKMFHPLATFEAKHRPYYIERNVFPDPILLQWLTQEDPVLSSAPKLKDEDD